MSGLTGLYWHNHIEVAITRECDMTVIQDAKISNTFEWQSLMVTYNEIHHKTHYDHNNVYLSVGIILQLLN